MHILTVHNSYLLRGGEDEAVDAEINLLRDNGHQVDLFSARNEQVASLGPVRVALRAIWSQESYTRLRETVHGKNYDLITAHNTFPLISPSIFYAAKAEGLPVVLTLHNYRLMCPNGLFFRQGRVCEDCLGRRIPWPGVVHRCYRGSVGATATVATMLVVHRALGSWQNNIDVFVALSQFSKEKFIEGGLPAARIVVKPNFVDSDIEVGEHRGRYALFVGRLSQEKGLATLIRAWERLKGSIPLKIVGDGPLRKSLDIPDLANFGIEWLGRQSQSEVYDLMGAATIVVVPSECYENFPRVVVEAFAKATPVLSANVGAVRGLIEHGVNGLVFNLGDDCDLAAKVTWVLDHPEASLALGCRARQEYETKYTRKRQYQALRQIFERAQTPMRRPPSN